MTLDEVRELSSAEFILWREYRTRYGFESDRIVWAIANVGAALSGAWGNRLDPKAFVPRFYKPEMTNEMLVSLLSGLPGAKVEFVPKEKLNVSG